MRKLSRLFLLCSLLLIVVACGPRNGVAERDTTRKPAPPRLTRLVRPDKPLTIAVGDEINIRLDCPDTISIDSVQVFLGGELKQTLNGEIKQVARGALETTLVTAGQQTGKSGLRLKVFFPGGKTENQSQQITFLSDFKPVEYTYRIVEEFAHDPEAYTQGLQYVDGWLYEGTGNYGTSSLRRVMLENGEISRIRNLDQSLFGEGITVFGERIYQLTYKSQVGFIYDKTSFEEIQKIYYQNREGWGLTHNGEELIMSDGTNIIYFLDPEMFTVTRQIEVYHNKGRADSLNELEYINGKIWANRYYTDEIVIIDPETGKVEGRINLKGILKPADRKQTTDVLNGIAWDREGDRIFVTGKYWPKLFEIKLTARPKSP
ncbi:MAG: glutaminyl-peptide cyclotransferase [Bacteroidales bacterium]|nr:glutaminyl-peptide cyclotransferase [Bacteroidales bacterium]